MNLLSQLRNWLQATFHRSTLESHMDTELQFHINAYAEDLIRKGIPQDEAFRRAKLEFGGVELTKEECREQRGVRFLETFVQDLRYAARTLRKSPGFTAIAVLTLALGIGANTAIFSLVNGILLHPLPYAQPEQLVSITGTYPKGVFVAMREEIRTMDVAAYSENHEVNLAGRGEPVRLTCALVSAELFSLLRARPELGRIFEPGEDLTGQDSYVVLSHALWEQQFNRDPSIIGRSIQLEGVNRQVLGVMPADFRFPSSITQLWLPLHNDPRAAVPYWAGDFMPVIGRLHPGIPFRRRVPRFAPFNRTSRNSFPGPMPATWNADVSVVELQNGMVADVRSRLFILLAAVALVLLIACANVANLTLSRSVTREKEMALRSALGANGRRLTTQLLTESVLLASLGGVLGLLFATRASPC